MENRHKRCITLRGRLLLAFVGLLAVVFIVNAAVGYLVRRREVADLASNTARALARSRATRVRFAGSSLVPVTETPAIGLIWIFEDGRVLERPPHVDAAIDTAAHRAASHPEETIDLRSQQVLLVTAVRTTSAGRSLRVVAAISTLPYQRDNKLALRDALHESLLMFPAALLVAALLLRIALRPVDRMASRAEQCNENNLDQCFAHGTRADELEHLASALDSLFTRIKEARAYDQRLAVELSHELRSPLTRLRLEVQSSLRREHSPAEYVASLERVDRDSEAMVRLVETLLTAAREEAGFGGGVSSLASVLKNAALSISTQVTQINIALVSPPSDINLAISEELAMRIIDPILENACRYAQTTVQLSALRRNGGVDISVEDDGPGVADTELDAIFLPGQRGTANAGQRDGDGAGVGLALARRLALAAGGDVRARMSQEGGCFVITLPNAEASKERS